MLSSEKSLYCISVSSFWCENGIQLWWNCRCSSSHANLFSGRHCLQLVLSVSFQVVLCVFVFFFLQSSSVQPLLALVPPASFSAKEADWLLNPMKSSGRFFPAEFGKMDELDSGDEIWKVSLIFLTFKSPLERLNESQVKWEWHPFKSKVLGFYSIFTHLYRWVVDIPRTVCNRSKWSIMNSSCLCNRVE